MVFTARNNYTQSACTHCFNVLNNEGLLLDNGATAVPSFTDCYANKITARALDAVIRLIRHVNTWKRKSVHLGARQRAWNGKLSNHAVELMCRRFVANNFCMSHGASLAVTCSHSQPLAVTHGHSQPLAATRSHSWTLAATRRPLAVTHGHSQPLAGAL
jgi:hypothetical protein